MKFIHIADMHFDSPYINLSDKNNMGDLRRLDQRKIFTKIIEYIKENSIPLFFISGDLYEHNYVKKSTIEFINNSFKQIPNTKIFISPGNHDPYLKDSFYHTYNWNNNVTIFKSEIEKVKIYDEINNLNINIYGYGFDDFYISNNCEIDNIDIESNENTINILVIHGTLDGSQNTEKPYNPLSSSMLLDKKFNYVALGHIHKQEIINNSIVYPGSAISHGFDELGPHGMIVGDITKDSSNISGFDNYLDFITLDDKEFKNFELDISNIYFIEDLISKIDSLIFANNLYIKIILTGNRNFEINTYEILRLIQNPNIIKIKDSSKIQIDISKYSNENTLKGIFVKNILDDLNNPVLLENKNIDKNLLEKALEIGLSALE